MGATLALVSIQQALRETVHAYSEQHKSIANKLEQESVVDVFAMNTWFEDGKPQAVGSRRLGNADDLRRCGSRCTDGREDMSTDGGDITAVVAIVLARTGEPITAHHNTIEHNIERFPFQW